MRAHFWTSQGLFKLPGKSEVYRRCLDISDLLMWRAMIVVFGQLHERRWFGTSLKEKFDAAEWSEVFPGFLRLWSLCWGALMVIAPI
jgi:hypothetical protein